MAAGAAAAVGTASGAPERYWSNINGGPFGNAANWQTFDGGDPVPNSTNYAIFNLASTYSVTFTNNRTTNQLMARLGHPTLALAGNTYTTNTVFVADQDGNTASLTFNTGRTISDDAIIGANFQSTGTLHQTGNHMWIMSDDYSLGEFGTGTHNISSGSSASTSRGMFIGTGSTGVGTMIVDGNSAQANASLDFYVGYFGDGTLNILNGADVTTPSFTVAAISGATGAVLVDGPGSTLTGGAQIWNIGNGGHGEMTVSNGAVVASANVQTASSNDADSEVTITGTGSQWTSTGWYYIGRNGMGMVTVEQNGMLSATASIVLGLGPTGMGDAFVQTGGQMVTDSQLQVAREGSAMLTVLTQSSVTSSGLDSPTFTAGYIGGLAGSSGTVQVSGANARWHANGGSVVVGFGGQGTLNINSAGRVNSVGGFIGRNPGSNGAVTISGNTSLWNSTGGVSVGLGPNNAAGGTGLLTVNGQGRFFSPVLNVGVTGTVEGTGTVESAVTNGGTTAPGNASTPAGTLTITGTYTQSAAGKMKIQLGSSESDKLVVSGNAALGGELIVELLGNFQPTDGQVFEIVSAGSVSGTFQTTTLPMLSGGGSLVVSYTGTKVRLTASAMGQPCPADVDGDGFIGFGDLNVVLSQFNTSGQGLQGDVDGDGDVDFADLNAVVSLYNTNCP